MRALLTGATGFLGRPLWRVLSERHEVFPLQGDVREARSYEGVPRVEVVYHLAALASVPDAIAEPSKTWDVNVNGTLALLEWARRTDAMRVIFVSSAHVYGTLERSPVDESGHLRPVNPYGASKAAGEMLIHSFSRAYGLDAVIVRPFNIYGPGQARGYLIPDILHQIHEGRSLVLGDPRPVRDFIHVDDAVDMMARLADSPAAKGRTFNLGAGQGYAISEVVDLAIKITGTPLRPHYDTTRFRAAETRELIVDNRAAREALDWTPRIGLEEGLQRTWTSLSGS